MYYQANKKRINKAQRDRIDSLSEEDKLEYKKKRMAISANWRAKDRLRKIANERDNINERMRKSSVVGG